MCLRRLREVLYSEVISHAPRSMSRAPLLLLALLVTLLSGLVPVAGALPLHAAPAPHASVRPASAPLAMRSTEAAAFLIDSISSPVPSIQDLSTPSPATASSLPGAPEGTHPAPSAVVASPSVLPTAPGPSSHDVSTQPAGDTTPHGPSRSQPLALRPLTAAATDNWAQICSTCSPPARYGAALAYDPSRGFVILFGGYNGGSYNAGYLGDTWEYKGGTWQQVTVSNAPLPRDQAGFDYDPNLGEFLLFGGYGCSTSACSSLAYMGDTWTFNDNSNTWTQLSPSNSPLARSSVGMTYDTALSETILYGGTDNAHTFGDIWQYSGGNWNPISTTGGIPARSNMGMVYDAHDGYLLVFGGCCSSTGPYGDTWYLSGSTWTQVTPFPSPAARDGLAMAYDSTGGFVLLFSGINSWVSPSVIYGDTWEYVSGGWTQLSPTTAPPSRYNSGMVYDSGDGYTALFGGINSNYQNVQDTWAFPPPFTATVSASPSNIDEGETATLTATPSGGYSPFAYSWSNLPQGCTGSNAASLSCTPTVYGLFTISVTVTDGSGHTASSSLPLTVNRDPQASFTASKTSLDVGQSSSLSGSASAGSGGYSWGWSGLPPGCSSSSQSFTCTPTGTGGGSNAAKLTVTDSDGGTGTYIVTLLVYIDPSVTTPNQNRSIDANQAVTFSTTASGGSGGDSFSWSGLPTGCSSANSATLSCTPTVSGSFSVKVSVTDSNTWTTTSSALALSISSDPSVVTPSANKWSVDTGQSVTFTTTASGGHGGYTYTWRGLPSGCSSANAASISCSPSASATSSTVVQLKDGNGYWVASSAFSFTVFGPPSVDYLLGPTNPPDANQQFTIQIDRYQDGSGGDQFAWVGLPGGCSSANLTYLTCSPTASGWYNVTVTATDSNGGSGSETPFTLHVWTDPSVATPSATPYSTDIGGSATFSTQASGGSGGYTYSWNLPTGLGCSGSSGGSVSCTPTSFGWYNLTASVTDSSGYQVASSPESFHVYAGPSVTISENRSVMDAGQSIQFWANASGGSGTYSYWYHGLPGGCRTANVSHLTCTATAQGPFSITVSVNDTLGGTSSSGPVSLTVDSDPTLTTWWRYGSNVTYANATWVLHLNETGGTPNFDWCAKPSTTSGWIGCSGLVGATSAQWDLPYSVAGTYLATFSLTDSTGWNTSVQIQFLVYYPISTGTPTIPPVDTGQSLTLSTWEAHGAPTLTSWWNDSSSGSSLCGPTTTSPGTTLSCTFTASWAGPHTLNITLRDGLGTPYYLTFTVSANARPALSIQSLPSITLTNATLNPTASVGGGSASFRYCFQAQSAAPWTCSPAGGTTSTSYTFAASYLAPGTYLITFSVLDAAGVNATTTRTLTVYYPLSMGSLTVSPSPSDEGWSTSANATLSNGVAGFVGWINDTTAGSSLCGPVTLAADGSLGCTFRPSWTGTHSLLLTVRDSLGTSRASARTLTVNPPLSITLFNATAGNRTVGAGGTLSTEVGAPVFLNATFGQGSPSYVCTWSSGATTIAPCSGSATTLDAIYEWSTVGTYTVTFTATDAAGATVAERFVLTVSPTMTGLALSAQWSPVDTGVLDNLTLSFQNGVAPFAFSWQFGDNHTVETLMAWVHHGWLLPGSYAINVTIRDAERANVSTTLVLTVASTLVVPCAPVSHGTLMTNDTLNFTLACASGGIATYHYHWIFGDGSGLTSAGPWATHAYSSAGQYQVSLTISDSGGGNATSIGLALQVQNPSPGPGPGPGSNSPPSHPGISAAEWFLIAVVVGVVALVAVTTALTLRRRARRGPSLASAGSGGSGGNADATPHIRMSLTTRPDQTEAELLQAVSKESGLDEGTVGTQLALLVREGTVQRAGDGPDASYRLPGAQASAGPQDEAVEAGTTAQDAKEEEEVTTRGRGLQAQVRQVLPEHGYVRTEELASKLGVAEPWLNSQLFVMEQRGELTTEEAPPKSGHFVVTRAADGVMFPAELRSLPPDEGSAADRDFPGPTPGPSSDSDLRRGS